MDYRIPKNATVNGAGELHEARINVLGGVDGGNGITGGICGVGKVTTKPPNGVMPKRFWDKQRISDLSEAVRRYLDTDLEIPLEWVSELNDLRRGQHDGD